MRASIPARPRNLRSCSATYSPHLFSLARRRCPPAHQPLGPALSFFTLPGDALLSIVASSAPPPSTATLSLLVFELAATALLCFFGISLRVVQLAGGLCQCRQGLVPRRPAGPRYTPRAQSRVDEASCGSVAENSFYPLTFPTTAGRAEPWVILSLTISAHARRPRRQRCQLRRNPVAIPVLRVTEFLAMRTLPGSPRASTLKPPGSLRVTPFVLSLDRRPDSLERCPVALAISSDRLTRARNLDIPNPNSSKAKKSPPEQEKAILRFLFRFVIVERFTPRQRSRLPT
jgi:multiple antibiotic resistance protein